MISSKGGITVSRQRVKPVAVLLGCRIRLRYCFEYYWGGRECCGIVKTVIDAISELVKLVGKLNDVSTDRRRNLFAEHIEPLFAQAKDRAVELRDSYREILAAIGPFDSEPPSVEELRGIVVKHLGESHYPRWELRYTSNALKEVKVEKGIHEIVLKFLCAVEDLFCPPRYTEITGWKIGDYHESCMQGIVDGSVVDMPDEPYSDAARNSGRLAAWGWESFFDTSWRILRGVSRVWDSEHHSFDSSSVWVWKGEKHTLGYQKQMARELVAVELEIYLKAFDSNFHQLLEMYSKLKARCL